MIRLIQFEMKKLFKSNFFRIMLLVFCLFIVVFYVFVHINTTKVEEVISEWKFNVHLWQSWVDDMVDSIDSGEVQEDKMMIREIDRYRNIGAEYEAILNAYEEKDWKFILNSEIKRGENELDILIYKKEYYSSVFPTLFTRETQMEYQKWLRDKEIVPVLRIGGDHTWTTVYDEIFIMSNGQDEILEEELVIKYSNKYSSTGIYYLNLLGLLFFGIFGAVFFLFLFGDIVTKEGIGRNGPINLLHTQPIQRGKILYSKLFTMLILSIFILVGTSVISLALGTTFDSFGFWNYPVLIYGEDYSHSFMNMSTFIIKSALFFLMILLFCYSILFLYSILTKKASTALVLTVATFILGIKLSGESALISIAPFIPFHYFSVPKVITMELAASLGNFNFTFLNGLLALGISSIMIFIATYIISVVQYRYSS